MMKVKRGSGWADALRSYEVLLDGEVIGQDIQYQNVNDERCFVRSDWR